MRHGEAEYNNTVIVPLHEERDDIDIAECAGLCYDHFEKFWLLSFIFPGVF